MIAPQPISFLQLDTFGVISASLVVATAWIAARNLGPRGGDRRMSSTIGIALQAASWAIACIGFIKPVLPWWGPSSLVSTTLVLLLGGSAVSLFLSAALTMGKNWSLVARTRDNHQLVRSGPFAMVRHPIYLALLLYLISIAAALGHWQQLLFAMPLYLAGTFIRIRDEEALLRARFGEDHARYAREVAALIPLIG